MDLPLSHTPWVFLLGFEYDSKKANFAANRNISERSCNKWQLTTTLMFFLTKISRYLSNISGSDAYRHKAIDDLKTIISHAGPPTFFFTFSSADMHWPALHALFSSYDSNTAEDRRPNVINILTLLTGFSLNT